MQEPNNPLNPPREARKNTATESHHNKNAEQKSAEGGGREKMSGNFRNFSP